MAYGIAGLGNAAGPLIGGLLTDPDESRDESAPRRMEIMGLAFVMTGIGLFTLTFDRAPQRGWISAPTIVGSRGR